MSCRRWLPGCLWLLTACSVGSPLVDDQELRDGVGPVDCNAPPSCEPIRWQMPSVPAATDLDLEHCADQVQCIPVGASTDATGRAASAACGGELVQALPQVASCSRATLDASAGMSELAYDGASWSRFELTIEAQAPLQITLRSPELRAVVVHLKGPISLELDDARVEDLRVDGAANPRGTPELAFLRLDGKQIRIGEPEAPFEGSLGLRASKLEALALNARETTLESVRLERGVIQTESLDASDATFMELDLSSAHSVLADFETEQCRLQLCNYASLISGKLNRSIVAACTGSSVRLYSSSLTSSELEGQYETDDSDFENTILGASTSTEILAFQSRFSSDALCASLQLLAVDAGSSIKCSACDPGFETDSRACERPSPPDVPSPVQGNFCASLPARRHLPLCDPDLPERMRQR